MIKIDTKEHEQLVEIYGRYKEYHDLYGSFTISDEQDGAIRNKAVDLQEAYNYYRILMMELERCIGNYHSIKTTLKSKMYSPARKMNTINRNKK